MSAPEQVAVTDFSAQKDLTPKEQEDLSLLEGVQSDKYKKHMAGTYTYVEQPTATLHNGQTIPLVGLGTWNSPKGDVGRAVDTALRCGYRHVDCAHIYGNEAEIGTSLSAIFSEGVLGREDVFITSKLWNNDHAADAVKPALQTTLRNLQLSYLDLYLIHWPVTGAPGTELSPSLEETWGAMEKLVDEGLVRSIGVSNCSVAKLKRILAVARIKPAVDQVETHPYFRNDEVLKFCKDNEMHMTAYSPLGSPESASQFGRRTDLTILHHPTVKAVAAKTGKSAGQVLIRWAVQHGTSVLPKSTNPGRIKENLDVFSWTLGDEDFKTLSTLDIQVRMVDGGLWLTPDGPYKRLSDLWDDPAEDHRLEHYIRSTYKTAVTQPAAKFENGDQLPLVGLGTWKSEPGEVGRAVDAALRAGYRHIDCAAFYFNEREVGDAIAGVLKEGVISRKDIWVTSKLWNTHHDKVEEACRKTLADLQVEYLDLYLIHWPHGGQSGPSLQPPYASTWKQMEGLLAAGLVRHIGVSNLSVVKLEALLPEARIKPEVNQVEAHPYFRNDAVLKFCRDHGIHMTAYSPLGSPDSAEMMKRGASVPRVMEDPVVKEISAALGKTPAQVLIRWAVQRGTSVLPKSVNAERLAANLQVTDWTIPEKDMARLSSLPTQVRMVGGAFIVSPEGPYRTVEDLWDEPTPSLT